MMSLVLGFLSQQKAKDYFKIVHFVWDIVMSMAFTSIVMKMIQSINY